MCALRRFSRQLDDREYVVPRRLAFAYRETGVGSITSPTLQLRTYRSTLSCSYPPDPGCRGAVQTLAPVLGALDLLSFAYSLTPGTGTFIVGGWRSTGSGATSGWRWVDDTPAENLNCGTSCALWTSGEPKYVAACVVAGLV